jgi:hypothetical protein
MLDIKSITGVFNYMSHSRTAIRKTIVSLLKSNATFRRIVGERVYESKVYPIDTVPSIVVYTPSEQVTEYSMSFPRSQTRQLTLVVEIYAKENSNIDQISDSLALEVEEIIAADPTLGKMVKDMLLNSSETIFSGDGDKPIAVATLTYHITYRTKETSPNKLI